MTETHARFLRSPICSLPVSERDINAHIDSGCSEHVTGGYSNATKAGASSQFRCKDDSASKFAPIFAKSREAKSSIPNTPSKRVDAGTKRKVGPHVLTQQSQSKRVRGSEPVTREGAPLADRLRPQALSEFVGQKHLTNPGSVLMNLLGSGNFGSIILWGPPGCGKTTLSRLLAGETNCTFKELSATSSGINDVRAVFEEAKKSLALTEKKTVLFLDEIHRFSKAQQDIFLPYVERGQIQLIGATTENPSFKLTSALLSRCRVLTLDRLTDEDIRDIIMRAVGRVTGVSNARESHDAEPSSSEDMRGSSQESTCPSILQITERVISSMVPLSRGDARTALSLLELVLCAKDVPEDDVIASMRHSVSTSYDRTGDSRYDMISALHKSIRGSHGSAAMYWLARMLGTGEDPVYIARRMVVCASEDVGLADNQALPLAVATLHACQQIGMPECRINLAHLVAYLAEAPKSTRAYEAYKHAEEAAMSDTSLPVPMAMRNAPTTLMKELGYSEGYKYNPSYAHPVHNEYLPSPVKREKILKETGDMSDKLWDETALQQWEMQSNGGNLWSGRLAK
ncbi:P-loop containing nucleoside triphosphate hydrolase protein [Pisolithus sp. B1]|nr:P-loop containing nucleoside triphosphate hydrolase protein [Pisolithus sp. B1]